MTTHPAPRLRILFSLLLVGILLSASTLPLLAAGPAENNTLYPAAPAAQAPWQSKVDPWVLATAADGTTEFLVFLTDQADLSAAASLPTKLEKGRYVYEALTRVAAATQGPLIAALEARKIEYRPYWVANMIWVRGDLADIQALAARADVAHLYANPTVQMAEPIREPEAGPETPAGLAPETVAWGVDKVNAPSVWAAGFTGQGAVIGGQDTGYQWDHPALKGKYRGWSGTAASHDYNWHDAIHSGGGSCGANSAFPCDDYGHGTHTMGTMVGDDGGTNQIGMAPGAKWIGCRNMNAGAGTPTTYSECYQWFIAPTPVGTMQGGDPAKAPDVINNSWGCPASEGCTDPNVLLTVVQNVRAAGIVTVHSAGNSGSSCSSVNEPAAIYAESFSVGATNSSDAIADFSSRGPVTVDGSGRLKPNVSAPGVSVYSSLRTGGYGTMSGTSMAGPHVAGAVALLISAYPWLAGDVDAIEDILEQSAVHLTSTQTCGGVSGNTIPNNTFGYGRIDVMAAYTAACAAPGAVTGVAIARLNASTLQLTWSPILGATGYEVWASVNAPYFTPDPSVVCTKFVRCITVTGTTYAPAALGDPNSNYTYVILSKHSCGARSTTPSNRTGEFDFSVIAGQ